MRPHQCVFVGKCVCVCVCLYCIYVTERVQASESARVYVHTVRTSTFHSVCACACMHA